MMRMRTTNRSTRIDGNDGWDIRKSIVGLLLAITALTGAWVAWEARLYAKPEIENQAQSAPANAGLKIIAIKFHADWCGFCKAMGGVYEEMQAKFDQQPVLWITLDQTREINRRQSAYLAHALNLKNLWTEHGGKTGFILLVNAKTRMVVDKFTHEQTLKEMGTKLVEAVKKASS